MVAVMCIGLMGCDSDSMKSVKKLKGEVKSITVESETDEYKEYIVKTDKLSFLEDTGSIEIVPSDHAYVEVKYASDMEKYGFYAKIEDNVISLGTDSKLNFNGKDFKAVIHANVNECQMQGDFSLNWDCVKSKDVKIGIDGLIKGDISGIDCQSADINISAVADLKLDGNSDSVTVTGSGAMNLDAMKLICKDADIMLSGTGAIKLSVSDNLKAAIDGVGQVTYYGSPEVKSEINGLGKVKQKEKEVYSK